MSIDELALSIQAGDHSLMEELWDKVVNLIKWKANQVMASLELSSNSRRVEFDDLVQAGYFALVEALKTYLPESGTFAAWLVYYLQTAFAETAGYRTRQGRMENSADSLDRPLTNDDNSRPLGDFVSDQKAMATMEGVEESIYYEELRAAIGTALHEIPDQAAEVLRLRYYQGLTLADIGAIRRTTPEHIRQMEKKAIRLLRKPSIACNLRPFYDFDFYCGTGLDAYRNTGMSIQERYLVLEEEHKKRMEQRRKERRKDRILIEHEKSMEQTKHEAQSKLARMTQEEKRVLLAKYGYTEPDIRTNPTPKKSLA